MQSLMGETPFGGAASLRYPKYLEKREFHKTQVLVDWRSFQPEARSRLGLNL